MCECRNKKLHDDPAVLIKAAALVFNADGSTSQLAVVDSSQPRFSFQTVEVEGEFGTDVGVSSGLKVKDRIVANPRARLVEGGEVQVDEPKDVAK